MRLAKSLYAKLGAIQLAGIMHCGAFWAFNNAMTMSARQLHAAAAFEQKTVCHILQNHHFNLLAYSWGILAAMINRRNMAIQRY
ncbi:MAG: hypothetical protein AAGJ09_14065 [Pseudomonadota bacterium]